jgi:predicted nuclease of predicted toxin-antitoxin system
MVNDRRKERDPGAKREVLSMAAARYDPDWATDPYEASGEPDDVEVIDASKAKDSLLITHDLSDDELRRFVGFDVHYDLMPLFGFIPQWAWLSVMNVAVGVCLGLATSRSARGLVVGGTAFPAVVLGVLGILCAGRRRRARARGPCEGRTVTISPRGSPSASRARGRRRSWGSAP